MKFILFSIIVFFSISIIKVITNLIRHNQTIDAIHDWRNLAQQIITWSKEIDCDFTKQSFLIFYSNYILGVKKEEISKKRVNEIRVKIMQQFGSHIPSLREEIRDSKLKQLGL